MGSNYRKNRPTTTGGMFVSDATAGAMINLCGGKTIGSVAITLDQEKALYKLYRFDMQEEAAPFLETGRFRNMARHAEADGLRIVAFLAHYCEPGEDPLTVIKLALSDAGYDVELDFEDED